MNNYFDEETHKYYYNGVEVPSVTEIAKPISFERLNDLPSHILNNARLRGTLVHEAIEEYLLTEEIEWEQIDPIALPYVEQFVMWFRTWRPKILFVEYRLYDEDYCGTLDLLCEIDGKIYLIDYKATSVIDKKSLSVQLEGYKRKLAKMGINVDKTAYLHLKKDGYVFKEIETNAEWFDILLMHNKFMRGNIAQGEICGIMRRLEILEIIKPYLQRYGNEMSFDTYMTSMCGYEEFEKVREFIREEE